MAVVQISQDDINRSKIVTPGWYLVEITGATDSMSKDNMSVNTRITGKIISSADGNKSNQFAGVPLPYWNFNSKAPGFSVPFFEALGGDVKDGARFDFNDAVGKRMEVFIGNGTFNGQFQNQIAGQYRKAKE